MTDRFPLNLPSQLVLTLCLNAASCSALETCGSFGAASGFTALPEFEDGFASTRFRLVSAGLAADSLLAAWCDGLDEEEEESSRRLAGLVKRGASSDSENLAP